MKTSAGAAMALLMLAGIAPAAAAAASNTFIIDLTYDSEMDMVRPEVHPHIQVHHDLHVTVSSGSGLSENRDRSTGAYYDENSMVQVLDSTDDEKRYAKWQTLRNGKLMRVQRDPQSTRVMTVTLLPNNTCRLDVVDRLKPGYTEYEFLRVSSHTMGFFSAYQVVATSCRIHS